MSFVYNNTDKLSKSKTMIYTVLNLLKLIQIST